MSNHRGNDGQPGRRPFTGFGPSSRGGGQRSDESGHSQQNFPDEGQSGRGQGRGQPAVRALAVRGGRPSTGFASSNRGGAQPAAAAPRGRGNGNFQGGSQRGRGGGTREQDRGGKLGGPAQPGPYPPGGVGGGYEEAASEGRGRIFEFPKGGIPAPSKEVKKKEDANVVLNKNVSVDTLHARGINIPLRCDYGTQGSNSTLASNYFRIVPNPAIVLCKYTISVKRKDGPNKDLPYRLRRRLLALLLGEQLFAAHGQAIATNYNDTLITTTRIANQGNADIVVPIKYWDEEDRGPGPNAPEYDVTLGFARTISMDDFEAYLNSAPDEPAADYNKDEAVTALNTIITKHPNTTNDVFALVGNRFYRYPVGKQLRDCFDLGGGLIAVRGYYASVRTSTLRILVNAHTQTSAFYPPVNVRVLMRLHGEGDHIALTVFLRRLRIKTSYMKGQDGKTVVEKVKTITGLSTTNARTEMFYNEEAGKEMSVADYFLQKYKIRLAHPEAFLLQIETIERDSKGNTLPKSEHKPVWLPPELGSVMPGQTYSKKLSPEQTTRMLLYAARPPAENARRLVDDGLRLLGLTVDNPILNAFGLTIHPEMVTVPARQLLAPTLHCQIKKKPAGTALATKVQYQPKMQTTRAASWNMADTVFAVPSSKFLKQEKTSPWGVLHIERIPSNDQDPEAKAKAVKKAEANRHVVKSCTVDFTESLESCGLGNQGPKFEKYVEVMEPFNPDASDHIFREELMKARNEGVLVILVILPSKDADLYCRLKFWADCRIGIHTVCSTFQQFQKSNPMTNANLTLKINAKLGGINHHVPNNRLGFLGKDTMVIGIDVTHPSPSSMKVMPSISAVVANIDVRYSQWPGSIRLQTQYQPDPRKEVFRPREMVQDMEVMIRERLDRYKVANGKLPKKLLVYRDGVSDSQYDKVLNEEYPGIVAACRKCYPPASQPLPPITIIVVTKRHHSRFYPLQVKDSDLALNNRLNGNPKPGTVVDRGVTMDQGYDFFLQAHAALQGTAKPAHYVIIKDDLRRSADDYQTVTHNLCYHFARATKAVSYCPPAYYADILAERGRCYLHKYYNARPEMQKEVFDWNRSPWVQSSTPHPDLANSMFYL